MATDGGSKNMLAKTAGAESSGGMRGENLHAAVDMSKKCMPYHAVVARNLLLRKNRWSQSPRPPSEV